MEGILFMKNAKKNKHLSFEDRCIIEEFLNNNYNFTQIGNRISKDRTTISDEVRAFDSECDAGEMENA